MSLETLVIHHKKKCGFMLMLMEIPKDIGWIMKSFDWSFLCFEEDALKTLWMRMHCVLVFPLVFVATLFIDVNAPKTHKIPFIQIFANTTNKCDL